MGSELFTEIHYFSVIYLNAFLLLFSLIKYSGFYLLAQIKNTSWLFFFPLQTFFPSVFAFEKFKGQSVLHNKSSYLSSG